LTSPEPPPEHNPPAIFDALRRHQVDYVVVGGLAVAAWAYERATKDTDIVVPTDDEPNDRRLRAALATLGATPLPLDAPGAAALGIHWEPLEGLERYKTTAGTLDVMRDPAGAAPYPQLRQRAIVLSTNGVPAVYVGREDLIAMKLAAGRIQDVLDLEALMHPANQEAARVKLRADDRDLLRGPDDVDDPTDPCEREVDQLRRALAATNARVELERSLVIRARELREVTDQHLKRLAGEPVPEIPAGAITSVASRLATAAQEIELAEERETTLMRERDRAGLWQRRQRQQLQSQLDTASERVELLQAQAETGVSELRDGLDAIEHWWETHHKPVVDTIAARREIYRRDRADRSRSQKASSERKPNAAPETDVTSKHNAPAPPRQAEPPTADRPTSAKPAPGRPTGPQASRQTPPSRKPPKLGR
jgi:hypothetical protein